MSNKQDIKFVSSSTVCVNGVCSQVKEVGFRDDDGKLKSKVKKRHFETDKFKDVIRSKMKKAYDLPVEVIVEKTSKKEESKAEPKVENKK